MDVRLDGASIHASVRACLLLLAEQGSQRVFLREVANKACALAEEKLKLATCHFSHSVNLLDQLLQHGADIPLVECSRVSSDGSHKIVLGGDQRCNLLEEAGQGDHGFFSDPTAHIATSV